MSVYDALLIFVTLNDTQLSVIFIDVQFHFVAPLHKSGLDASTEVRN